MSNDDMSGEISDASEFDRANPSASDLFSDVAVATPGVQIVLHGRHVSCWTDG